MTKTAFNTDYYGNQVFDYRDLDQDVKKQRCMMYLYRDMAMADIAKTINNHRDSTVYVRGVQVRPSTTATEVSYLSSRHYKSTWDDFQEEEFIKEYKKFFEPLKKTVIVDLDCDDDDCI